MIELGTRRECFFDDYLIDTKTSTTEQILHKPIPEEIIMTFEEEWDGNTGY